MLRFRSCILLLAALASGAVVHRLVGQTPDSGVQVPRGTKPAAFKIAGVESVPGGMLPGKAIDVVGELGEPPQSGVVILNVTLLGVDSPGLGRKVEAVVAAFAPAQEEVLRLMEKHRMTLSVRLHKKEEPKR